MRPNRRRLTPEHRRVPALLHRPVVRRPGFRPRVPPHLGIARVTGDALPRLETLHRGRTQADVQALSHERVRYTVVAPIPCHRVIAVDGGGPPFGVLVRRGGQGGQGSAFVFPEGSSRPSPFLKRSGV